MAGYNGTYYPSSTGSYIPYTNYQTTVPLPQQPQPQNNSGNIMTIFVNSDEDANNYPVAAGTTVLLLCFNLKKFWLKSTSTSGVPEQLREFSFEETTVTPAQNQSGVTREEFDSLSKKIDKLISDLGGAANG